MAAPVFTLLYPLLGAVNAELVARVKAEASDTPLQVDGFIAPTGEQPHAEASLRGDARRLGATAARAVPPERGTIGQRLALIRRFAEFTNQYPWQWLPAEAEAFFAGLNSGAHPVAVSTARGYQLTLRLFGDYVTDPRYGWLGRCEEQFGQVPVKILHEWNTVVHVGDFEGRPGRRPLSYDEVQVLFDAADGRVEQIRVQRRKGALTAMRDAAFIKTVYAFGLRRREAALLDLVDLRANPKVREYGRAGAAFVRHGKASRGGPPKRRTVLIVPEMDWVVGLLDQYVAEVRPLLGPGKHPALWVTERRGRMSLRSANEAFENARGRGRIAGRA